MLTHTESTVRAILNNFRVWSRIFSEGIKTSTIKSKLDWLPSRPCWIKKIRWTLVHQRKSYRRRCWTTQNRLCAQFWTTLKCGCQYLRNGSRGQQLETNLIDRRHSRVWRKNNELWSTNKKVIGADVDLLNSTMRILLMLMHFSLGHVILLPWVFRLPQTFYPIGLTVPGGLTLGFALYF